MNNQNRDRLQIFFRHFAMRLLERYDIMITFEEYFELHSLNYIRNQKYIHGEQPYYTGYVIIKETKVNVYRGAYGFKPFLTAVPIHCFKKSNRKTNKP